MTIEEIFKLIKKGFSDYIKEISEEKSRNELIANFLDKSDIIAVKLNDSSYKSKYEVQKVLPKEESATYVETFREKVTESNYNLETLNLIKSYFGKEEIQGKVENFSLFFVVLNIINKNIGFVIDKEMFARIFGMAIYNNNRIYDKSPKEKNKGLNVQDDAFRKETTAIIKLKPYFSYSGSIIANDDVITFVDGLFDLFETYYDNPESDIIMEDCNFNATLFIEYMQEQLLIANSNKRYMDDDLGTNYLEATKVSKKERREIIEHQRQDEQELARYFDGEKILIPCASIEKFISLVNSCNLSEENKKRIITKMQTFMSKENDRIQFLSDEEQEIYKLAIEKQLGNIQVKTYLEEIYILLEMHKEGLSSEDKLCIENEVQAIIKSLGFLLNVRTTSLSLQN